MKRGSVDQLMCTGPNQDANLAHFVMFWMVVQYVFKEGLWLYTRT